MMDWTDRHCRYLHRLMTRHARLYTEMLTTGAVIHGDRERLLGFDPFERPLVLQLGGSEPADLARAAAIADRVLFLADGNIVREIPGGSAHTIAQAMEEIAGE